MISIGAVVGGPECRFFLSYLSRLMTYCTKNCVKCTDAMMVNVVYHIPGSIIRPDYIGLRTGRFSRRDKILVVQVAVETEWVASTNAVQVLQYIYESADEALGVARSTFEKNGIDYDLVADRRFLDNWKAVEGFGSYLDSFPRDETR